LGLLAAASMKADDSTKKKAEVPAEITDKVKVFEASVAADKTSSKEVKGAVARGAEFFGKPYFVGGSDYGADGGFFTFWLFNPKESPTYRAYSVDVTKPVGQALMKTVLFGFEQKAQWIAVYPQADDANRPRFVTVYP
jgi:hypothetical protein